MIVLLLISPDLKLPALCWGSGHAGLFLQRPDGTQLCRGGGLRDEQDTNSPCDTQTYDKA